MIIEKLVTSAIVLKSLLVISQALTPFTLVRLNGTQNGLGSSSIPFRNEPVNSKKLTYSIMHHTSEELVSFLILLNLLIF